MGRISAMELEISQGAAGRYLVSARSDAGDTGPVPTRFGPLDSGTLDSRLRQVELALFRSVGGTGQPVSPDESAILDLGREMFEFLFFGQVREHLAAMRAQAAVSNTQLQMRLRIRPPELAALPWEFLYDQSRDDYLCLSWPLVRHVEVLEPHRPLEVAGPLRILGMVSDPSGLAQLAGDKERKLLQESLAPLISSGRVELHWVPGQTWRDLRAAVHEGSWHVFHFIGHGHFSQDRGEGALALADEDGKPYWLTATDLGRVLVGAHRSLRLVVLNSCLTAEASSGDVFSSTAAVLMRRGIPAVVAMQYQISDRAAIAFAGGLYEGVRDLLPVDQAVTRARLDMKLSGNSLEWAVPALYLRSSSGSLFRTGEPPSPADAVPPGPPPRKLQTTPGPQADGESAGTLLGEIGHASAVRAAAFSPDGAWVATGSDGGARLWDAAAIRQAVCVEHRLHWVWAVAFSPDSKLLATASGDRTAALWHVPTGQHLMSLHHDGLVGAVAFSPDGDLLATASEDGTARLWDVRTAQELARFGHGEAVQALAFSPDATLLASASDDRTARLWDVETGQELGRLDHRGPVQSVAFSPDGTLLATASSDWTARLWDVETGQELARLDHRGLVQSVAFSPDGTLLATASSDRTARLWGTHGGKPVARLQHQGSVWVLGFSPDASRLITGSDDRSARIWATGKKCQP